MSINLGLDDEVNAITRSTRIVEWIRNFLTLARKWSKQNILGNVALANTGTADGNAPVLDSNGRLDASLTPEIPASKVTSGVFGESQIPGLDASKITGELSASRIKLPVSKLTGTVPLERIPLSKRPLAGITEVRTNPTVARRVTDQAKYNAQGHVPLLEIKMSQSGSVLFFWLEETYYVAPGQGGGGGDGDSPGPPPPGQDPDFPGEDPDAPPGPQ